LSILFFLFSLWVAWSAYNLYYPVRRYPGPGLFSFLSGWLNGELAFHYIFWEVWIMAFFVLFGGVWGPHGMAGFLLCIAGWFAMANFYMTGEKAKPAMNDALTIGLGEDYEKQIDPTFVHRFPEELDQDRLRHPFAPIDRGSVEVIKNVSFGHFGQRLDIYRPRKPVTNAPVLLQIHGGAWTRPYGTKERQAIPLMTHMAKRGWICVSVDYRLCPDATWPEHVVDCKEGICWVKHEIEEYGGNPNFIVVTGGSAGGHLSSLVALTPNDPQFQPGFEDEDTTVQGAVPFYGVYDFTEELEHHRNDGLYTLLEENLFKAPRKEAPEEYRHASPVHRINPEAPPFLIIHGECDSLVPVEEARAFADRLRNVSEEPVLYAEIPGAQHAFDMFASIRSEHTKHGVEKYLAWLYTRYLRSTEG
jgi:acetyl esterase/lipase